MPGIYASAKVTFLHASKLHVSKKVKTYDSPLLKEFITTFAINILHLPGGAFTYKNKFLQENNFFHRKNNFSLGYLEFPTGIKELPTGI